ncbi:hypothetical protein [Uliginosibacterium sediminicola]|uniref:Uncharacterized protein n=1 Tax=Uliginosibacterium sediminicola TaxID=2024550 RepID=A0ABU9YY26_9RHOO
MATTAPTLLYSQRVVIEREFDRQRGYWGRGGPKNTLLGVEVAGERRISLTLDGWPEEQAGATVTAFFREPNDWQQLVGWVNHRSREIIATFPPISWIAIAIELALFVAWLAFLLHTSWLWVAPSAIRLGVLAGTAVLGLVVGYAVKRLARTQRERRVLEAFKDSLMSAAMHSLNAEVQREQ